MTGPFLPRVTVITPAYNVSRYVGEAMDSVLAQTFRDFEYLVVDDGSTDGTVAEIRRRVEIDQRARLIEAEHGGPARARNVAIAEATGEYIAFLDSDDRWHSDFLANQLDLIESLDRDVAAVFARSRVISERGRVYLLRWQRSGYYDYDDMLIDSCPPRTGSSLLIRASAFEKAGVFTEAKTIQDLDMWLRIQRDSGMPYFWGNTAYLLDIRMRSGAVSRDHALRFEGLGVLITDHAPHLQRSPAGMAYVRAAVFAYRAGAEDFAVGWTAQARQAGLRSLLADSYGRRVLGWSVLGPAGRRGLRRCNAIVRWLVGVAIGQAGGLMRRGGRPARAQLEPVRRPAARA
jgi:glycosyltransferase involved in cell wall biosynthesis